MSLYQFAAVIDGINEMNEGDDLEAPSADDFEAAIAAHDELINGR